MRKEPVRIRVVLAAMATVLLGAVGCSATDDSASERRTPDAQPAAPTREKARSVDEGSPLFAIAENTLFRLDRESLDALPGPRVPLRGRTTAASFSPDGTTLTVGAPGSPWVRFVDLDEMRAAGDVRLRRRGSVDLTAWLSDRRVLVIVTQPGCCPSAAGFSIVDRISRRVVAKGELGGTLEAAEPWAGHGWVFLVSPPGAVGDADLVLVARDGSVRHVELGITAGSRPPRPGGRGGEGHHPDLAVDPANGRAVVVGAGVVAEVALETLRITYHELREPISLLGRIRNWLEPEALADPPAPGTVRKAVWVGNGRVATSGWNAVVESGRGIQRPIGLQIIDTRKWTRRVVDERMRSFAYAAGTLVASDIRLYGGEATGLVGYETDGRLRFHVFDEKEVGTALILGEHAYVTGRWSGRRADIVDLRSGRVIGRAELPAATVLDPSTPTVGCSWPC